MNLFDNIRKPSLPEQYEVAGVGIYNRLTFPSPDKWTFANVDTNIVIALLLANNCPDYWPYEDGNYDEDYKSIWKEFDYEAHCDLFKIIASNDILPGNWVVAGVYHAQ